MTGRTFRLTSLGCAKNLVDSEGLAALLIAAGWRMVADGPADLVVINTCAFVEDAAQESVDMILDEIDRKREGEAHWLAVVGCLPQKYDVPFADSLPEIDIVLGTADLTRIVDFVERLRASGEGAVSIGSPSAQYFEFGARALSTPRHRAYLKVAEGCDNACAFCIIGRLRGPFRSRTPQNIIDEAIALTAEHGVVELSVVAQDLTRYGSDLSPRISLAELLAQLDAALAPTSCKWLRLLYLHPARVDDDLLRAMVDLPLVVPYLDMPLQHVADGVLTRMSRPQTSASTREVVQRVRRAFPAAAIRTTFLVGHPGETDDDFAELLAFVQESRFEHLGAFAWSEEEGTASHAQDGWVDAAVRAERVDRLMRLQQEISREVQQQWVGRTVEVLVEEVLHKHDDEAYSHVGRIRQQAPEIDGVTYLRAPSEQAHRLGDLVTARVTQADAYDLFADSIE